MPTPSAEQRARLREVILAHMATPATRPIIEALFANDDAVPARAADLVQLFPKPRPTEGAIRRRVSDLRKRLEQFFDENAHAFPIRVYIEKFRLRFEQNAVESRADFRTEFWSHYFASDKPVRILYPEPEFFIDEHPTYFRNPAAIATDVRQAFEYLDVAGGAEKLERAYSFVPSGIVRAMLFLVEMFQERPVRVHATPVWPFSSENHDPDADLIVLGTPTTSPITNTLEERMPARTTPEGIEIGGMLKYRDANQEDTTGEKWGLVTRRAHRFRGRLITVISAKHGRTIQAITEFLTRRDDMEKLAQHVRSSGESPHKLQTVFRVDMSKGAGEPRIEAVEPVEILQIVGTIV